MEDLPLGKILSDLTIPAIFLDWMFLTMSRIRSGERVFTDKAIDKFEKFTRALAQKVLRETTEKPAQTSIGNYEYASHVEHKPPNTGVQRMGLRPPASVNVDLILRVFLLVGGERGDSPHR